LKKEVFQLQPQLIPELSWHLCPHRNIKNS
jgi:hypothetical protein